MTDEHDPTKQLIYVRDNKIGVTLKIKASYICIYSYLIYLVAIFFSVLASDRKNSPTTVHIWIVKSGIFKTTKIV